MPGLCDTTEPCRNPANMIRWLIVGLLLGQRCRQCTSVERVLVVVVVASSSSNGIWECKPRKKIKFRK